jgi:hypothetical protein
MRNIFIILAIATLSFSCKKTTRNNCADTEANCKTVLCFTHNYYFDFRVVDKVTGADLVFGTNPRYAAGDIRLFYDAAATMPIQLVVDNSAKTFRTLFAREKMYLVVAGTATYKLDAAFRLVDCCSSRVRQLEIEGLTVCACCSDIIPVAIN